MKHVIIGTAGHIDHGKTTLIKALTGRDTDTLKEEKARGISINLGFTFFDLPSGRRAGIIDVPGHEKFVKNMLAGVSSIDVVLLVIAADEGIMPQTREHFEILQLLDVKKGIIVLSKVDMVEEDWAQMVKEELLEEFKGTFLEKAPVHMVSSKTGQGINELVNEIDHITEEVTSKDTEGHFRLPVDRVFSISGFGTVVTGTVISGRIKEGESVEVYPSKVVTKVRGIQVHENSVKFAEAGQRTAINLANVKVEEVERGYVISKEGILEPSIVVDCNIHYLKNNDKPLVNNQRVKLYHGTDEIICRVMILDKEEIKPGENAYVQLRLEKPLTAQRNDRYVIRSYSPMYTIGGGSIIEPAAKKAKRFDTRYLDELKVKESGKTQNIIENTVYKLSGEFPDESQILKALGKNEENIGESLESLVREKVLIKLTSLDKSLYIHKNFIKDKTGLLEGILTKFHNDNPLKAGLSKEEFKNKVFGKNIKQKIYDEILALLEENNKIAIHGNYISLYDFQIKLTKEQQKIKDIILNAFRDGKYSPPKYEDLCATYPDKKTFKMVYDSLLDMGMLHKIADDIVFLSEYYEEAKQLVTDFINQNGSITAAQGRDLFNTSRKFAVGLLENFDSIKLTKRVEDSRILY